MVRNILIRSGSLSEDIRVHQKRVSSAIGSPGLPILGVVSVLIMHIRLFWGFNGRGALSSIQHHLFPLLSGGHTSPRCLCTRDWLGLAAHHVHLYLCAQVKISREVFNHHVMDFDFFVCCFKENFDPSELFPHGLFAYSIKEGCWDVWASGSGVW